MDKLDSEINKLTMMIIKDDYPDDIDLQLSWLQRELLALDRNKVRRSTRYLLRSMSCHLQRRLKVSSSKEARHRTINLKIFVIIGVVVALLKRLFGSDVPVFWLAFLSMTGYLCIDKCFAPRVSTSVASLKKVLEMEKAIRNHLG